MKTVKFITGWIFISVLLLLSVVLTDFVSSYIKHNAHSTTVTELYSIKDMLLGILSESLRALLLCYLFPQLKNAGHSFKQAIKFGLVISALIGTMWLVIGYGSFKLKDPGSFVIYDGVILAIQGVLSGAGLHLLYKRRFITE